MRVYIGKNEDCFNMERKSLNEVYRKMDGKMREIAAPFRQNRDDFSFSYGYFNGHYYKNENGEYEMDYFPIPVVSVEGICDIEIGLEEISISTKRTRREAVSYDYGKLSGYHFEVYGVENYLEDYYTEGNTIEELLENVRKSPEEHIGFTFYFSYDLDGNAVYEFVKFLRDEGFFY